MDGHNHGDENSRQLVGQDDLLRAGCQAALDGHLPRSRGGLPNRRGRVNNLPQVNNLPHQWTA